VYLLFLFNKQNVLFAIKLRLLINVVRLVNGVSNIHLILIITSRCIERTTLSTDIFTETPRLMNQKIPWLHIRALTRRCLAMDYSGFLASCPMAPCLGLFVPRSLTVHNRSLFYEVSARDLFLWLGFLSPSAVTSLKPLLLQLSCRNVSSCSVDTSPTRRGWINWNNKC
jgi:hypothetical protein